MVMLISGAVLAVDQRQAGLASEMQCLLHRRLHWLERVIGKVGVCRDAEVQQVPELLSAGRENRQKRMRRGADPLPAPKHTTLGFFPQLALQLDAPGRLAGQRRERGRGLQSLS